MREALEVAFGKGVGKDEVEGRMAVAGLLQDWIVEEYAVGSIFRHPPSVYNKILFNVVLSLGPDDVNPVKVVEDLDI